MNEPQEPSPSASERKRRLEKVFGDVLPDQTSDDTSDGDDNGDHVGRDEEWLRGEVPPHHG